MTKPVIIVALRDERGSCVYKCLSKKTFRQAFLIQSNRAKFKPNSNPSDPAYRRNAVQGMDNAVELGEVFGFDAEFEFDKAFGTGLAL